MIKNVLFLSLYFLFLYKQINACKPCIVNSTCDDDYIHFNVSIPNDCPHSLKAYFSYQTDLTSERYYLNQTFNCQNCYYDLHVEPIHDAWIYYLTFESPKTIPSCSAYKANCGGKTSRYVWIITGGLSGLFVVFGVLLCTIRLCRTPSGPQRRDVN
ncbi:hypothetical protein I4U23_014562 [Adineta vaga]|nr:hypothetical protein I4U23_014562 [Adineta vaga]